MTLKITAPKWPEPLPLQEIKFREEIARRASLPGFAGVEADPIFMASPAYGITSGLIGHWNSAYSWGNHASAGYVSVESDPVFSSSEAFNITATDITNLSNLSGTNTGDQVIPPDLVTITYFGGL